MNKPRNSSLKWVGVALTLLSMFGAAVAADLSKTGNAFGALSGRDPATDDPPPPPPPPPPK